MNGNNYWKKVCKHIDEKKKIEKGRLFNFFGVSSKS
jgi:hypothetical protein